MSLDIFSISNVNQRKKVLRVLKKPPVAKKRAFHLFLWGTNMAPTIEKRLRNDSGRPNFFYPISEIVEGISRQPEVLFFCLLLAPSFEDAEQSALYPHS